MRFILASVLVAIAIALMASTGVWDTDAQISKCPSGTYSKSRGHYKLCYSKRVRTSDPVEYIDLRVCVVKESGECTLYGAPMAADYAYRIGEKGMAGIAIAGYKPGGYSTEFPTIQVVKPPNRYAELDKGCPRGQLVTEYADGWECLPDVAAPTPVLCHLVRSDEFKVGLYGTCPKGYTKQIN